MESLMKIAIFGYSSLRFNSPQQRGYPETISVFLQKCQRWPWY